VKKQMLKNVEKIKENKKLKLIGDIAYVLLFIIVVLMLVVVILQRASNNSISIGGYRMFSVATGSMIPVYNVGDVLVAKEVKPDEIKIDDDIVYKGAKGSFKDKVVTHRVISIEKEEDNNYKIITKGVANTEQDPEIDQTQVYGKVIYKIKSLSFLGKMMKNMYVFYFAIFIPAALIIYKIFKNLLVSDDDEEDNDGKDSKDN
jgi:signal peptidase I